MLVHVGWIVRFVETVVQDSAAPSGRCSGNSSEHQGASAQPGWSSNTFLSRRHDSFSFWGLFAMLVVRTLPERLSQAVGSSQTPHSKGSVSRRQICDHITISRWPQRQADMLADVCQLPPKSCGFLSPDKWSHACTNPQPTRPHTQGWCKQLSLQGDGSASGIQPAQLVPHPRQVPATTAAICA